MEHHWGVAFGHSVTTHSQRPARAERKEDARLGERDCQIVDRVLDSIDLALNKLEGKGTVSFR